jgi:hypothetical protein
MKHQGLLTYSSESSEPESEDAHALGKVDESGSEEASSGLEEEDANMLRDMSDEEEKTALAEALLAKHEGKRMMKTGRRTFTQAKALVREIRKTRSKPRFFSKRKPQQAGALDEIAALFNKLSQSKKHKRTNPKKYIAANSTVVEQANGLCYRCGKSDHHYNQCPNKDKNKSRPKAHATAGMISELTEEELQEAVRFQEIRLKELRALALKKKLEGLKQEEQELLREETSLLQESTGATSSSVPTAPVEVSTATEVKSSLDVPKMRPPPKAMPTGTSGKAPPELGIQAKAHQAPESPQRKNLQITGWLLHLKEKLPGE